MFLIASLVVIAQSATNPEISEYAQFAAEADQIKKEMEIFGKVYEISKGIIKRAFADKEAASDYTADRWNEILSSAFKSLGGFEKVSEIVQGSEQSFEKAEIYMEQFCMEESESNSEINAKIESGCKALIEVAGSDIAVSETKACVKFFDLQIFSSLAIVSSLIYLWAAKEQLQIFQTELSQVRETDAVLIGMISKMVKIKSSKVTNALLSKNDQPIEPLSG